MSAKTEEHGKTSTVSIRRSLSARMPALNEVQSAIRRFGCIDVCSFDKGWFEETLPQLREPVAAALIDVDLESSTGTASNIFTHYLSRAGSSIARTATCR
jgi:hypothetical protein